MIATTVLILRLVLAVALYAFLAWALWTLLRELKQQGDTLSLQKMPGIRLAVQIEPGEESLRHFSQPQVMIGRDPNCDLAMVDEAMSAHHARLTYHHGQWWLEDLNSTNGTFLNREKLTIPAVVIPGDTFKCGNTLFDIQPEGQSQLSPAEAH